MIITSIPVGTRVKIWDGSGDKFLGFGVFEGIESRREIVSIHSSLEPSMETVDIPRLRLDNGQLLFGYECFWEIVSAEEEAYLVPRKTWWY
jgi:hypothetical protein